MEFALFGYLLSQYRDRTHPNRRAKRSLTHSISLKHAFDRIEQLPMRPKNVGIGLGSIDSLNSRG